MATVVSKRQTAAKITIHSENYDEIGVCVILRTRPLTVLVPSHVCVGIEEGVAKSISIGGSDFQKFEILPSPFLEREHLAVIRCQGRSPAGLSSPRIPRNPATSSAGMEIECAIPSTSGQERRVTAAISEVSQNGTEVTLRTNLGVANGDSGSPIFVKGGLHAVCMGMTPTGDRTGNAVAIALTSSTLRELRRIVLRRQRAVILGVALLLLLSLAGLGTRSWMTFELAGVDGPMNTIEDVESPNTITAYNGQLLTLRPTWKRTFPTSVRWWLPFPSQTDGALDRVVVGTRIENGVPGSLYLLDNLGRVMWSYSVPDGECVYSDDVQTYDGFYVYRVFVGDVTGDGQQEVIASFVHNDWFPCKIVVFRQNGELLGEYWHPGYLRTFAIGRVGHSQTPMFILTGSNNRFRPEDSPWNPQELLAFDTAQLSGQAPPYTGTGSGGNEKWYYLVPDVDADHKSKVDDIVIGDSNGDGTAEILAHTSDGRFYYLDENGDILDVALGDDYLKEFGDQRPPDLVPIDLNR